MGSGTQVASKTDTTSKAAVNKDGSKSTDTKSGGPAGSKATGYIYQNLASIGIYSTGGDGWDTKVTTICDSSLPADICEWARAETTSDKAGKSSQPVQRGVTKLTDHWSQQLPAGQFQQFVDNWSETNKIGTPYNLEGISKIEVSTFVGESDAICSANAAREAAQRIGTLQNYYTLKE